MKTTEVIETKCCCELNARENAHWYKKYIAIRNLIDRAITIGNAQDPGVKLLARWRIRNEIHP